MVTQLKTELSKTTKSLTVR